MSISITKFSGLYSHSFDYRIAALRSLEIALKNNLPTVPRLQKLDPRDHDSMAALFLCKAGTIRNSSSFLLSERVKHPQNPDSPQQEIVRFLIQRLRLERQGLSPSFSLPLTYEESPIFLDKERELISLLGHLNKIQNSLSGLQAAADCETQRFGLLTFIFDLYVRGASFLVPPLPSEESEFLIATAAAHRGRRTSSQLFEAYRKNELILIPTGYAATFSTKGHLAYIVLYKQYLIVVNRGNRPDCASTLKIYLIDPSKVDSTLIEQVKYLNLHNPKQFFKVVYGDLPMRLLDTQIFPSQYRFMSSQIKKIMPVEQGIGNCRTASSKTAMLAAHAIFAVTLCDNSGNIIRSRLERVKKQFKEIWVFVRAGFLENHIIYCGFWEESKIFFTSVKKLEYHVKRHGKNFQDCLNTFPQLKKAIEEVGYQEQYNSKPKRHSFSEYKNPHFIRD